MKFNLSSFLSIAILLISISSVNHILRFPVGNTFFWWGIFSCVITAFILAKKKFFNGIDKTNILVVMLYLYWNIICIFRGMFVAENYWEWKNLVTFSFVLLWPLSIYVTTNVLLLQKILNSWVKFALPAFIVFLYLIKFGDGYGRYLAPVGFLLLFFPVIPKKWKILLLILSAIVVIGAPTARSNAIRFIVFFAIGLIFYFRHLISYKLLEVARWLLLVIPVILFVLGVTGKFNIFKMDEYIGKEYKTKVVLDGQVQEEDLTTDTRTFLYEEVLSSALKYNYMWLGRSPARGNESASFGDFSVEVLKTGKMERPSNEVSVLNIFTWTGIVGVVLYFAVFFWASYLAINRSNNWLIKLIGMCVAFRWAYAWVEEFNEFDLSNFILWTMIGMCLSSSFRSMTDIQMKAWIWGILDKKYQKLMASIQVPAARRKKHADQL